MIGGAPSRSAGTVPRSFSRKLTQDSVRRTMVFLVDENGAAGSSVPGYYLPGECIDYEAVIYNAKHSRGRPPDLESNIVLYREGAEVLRSEPAAVDLQGVSDLKRIPLTGNCFWRLRSGPETTYCNCR